MFEVGTESGTLGEPSSRWWSTRIRPRSGVLTSSQRSPPSFESRTRSKPIALVQNWTALSWSSTSMTTLLTPSTTSASSPRRQPELGGDGLDAELHQELELVGRQVLLHPRHDCGVRLLRRRPVGRAHGLQESVDVAALPIEVTEPHRAAVTDEENGVAGESPPQGLDVLEPLLVKAVGQKAVLAAIDLVAEEDNLLVRAEDPGAVVW